MNDIARMVSTIAIWLIMAILLVALAVFDSLAGEFAPMFVIGAVFSTFFIWRGSGKEQEQERIARLKRNEGLAQRVAREEELDEEDITTLEELLEEQRATRHLRDR